MKYSLEDVIEDYNGIYLASEQKAFTSCKNVYPVPSGCYGTITNNLIEDNTIY